VVLVLLRAAGRAGGQVKSAKADTRKKHVAALKKHKQEDDHEAFEDEFGHHVVHAIQGLVARVEAIGHRGLIRDRDPELYKARIAERDEQMKKRAIMFKGTMPRRIKAFQLEDALEWALKEAREQRQKRGFDPSQTADPELINDEVRCGVAG